jgi:hypothetical protein
MQHCSSNGGGTRKSYVMWINRRSSTLSRSRKLSLHEEVIAEGHRMQIADSDPSRYAPFSCFPVTVLRPTVPTPELIPAKRILTLPLHIVPISSEIASSETPSYVLTVFSSWGSCLTRPRDEHKNCNFQRSFPRFSFVHMRKR